jgi:phytoene dehydrogenase-like protein
MADILIIGGGVSGLSAGIFARLHGHTATVCERHAVPGGNLTGWDRGGFHIDNCIHWLTGTNPASNIYRMWDKLGVFENTEIIGGESLYTCALGGQSISIKRNLRDFQADLLALSPEDEKEIRSLVLAIETLQGLFGIGGENHDEQKPLSSVIPAIPALLKYYNITTGQLGERFSHPLLKFFFGAFWGDNFGAFTLIFVFAHYCGYNGDLPSGGSTAMANRMAERLRSLGGTLLLKTEAVKIHVENGRAHAVTFADGTTREADYVVLTGDPASMFGEGKLLDAPMPRQLRKLYENPRMRRFSSYHCAFACDTADLPFHGDYIFPIPEAYREMLCTNRLILREFSHEPTFSPAGKQLIQTLTYVYEEDAEAFITQRREDRVGYKERKREISELTRLLIEAQFPELAGKLTLLDVWTPATYRRYTDANIGSWMSFALPAKTIPSRLSNRIPGLSNVILATQWQQSPGGLPIAADGGKKAIRTVNELEEKAKGKA